MTTIDHDAELSDYNRNAIALSQRISEVRGARLQKRYEDVHPTDDARTLDDLLLPINRAAAGVAAEYERMGNQPVPDQLAAAATAYGIELEHLGLTIGTVLHGIDLKQPLDDDQVTFLRSMLLARKVIFFRDQHLDATQQATFGRYFGELDAFPFGPASDDPFVSEIRHGRASPGTENGWHTDVTWMECPSLGSIAQLIDVPPIGGDTLFADSHAAALGMPRGLFEDLEYVNGINDYRYFLGVAPAELRAEYEEKIPFGVSHPLLRTHPETGKTALYLNMAFLRPESLYDTRTDEPLGEERSREIVATLANQHARPEYQCRFSWEPGSIAFWDNRAVQHYASSDYYPHHRLLRRVTISGDRPFYDPNYVPPT